jgi:hypothetical protein
MAVCGQALAYSCTNGGRHSVPAQHRRSLPLPARSRAAHRAGMSRLSLCK